MEVDSTHVPAALPLFSHDTLLQAIVVNWKELVGRMQYNEMMTELITASVLPLNSLDYELVSKHQDCPIVMSQVLLERFIIRPPPMSAHRKSDLQVFLEALYAVHATTDPKLEQLVMQSAANGPQLQKDFDSVRSFEFVSLRQMDLEDVPGMSQLQRAPISKDASELRSQLQQQYRNAHFGVDGVRGSDYALLPPECVTEADAYIPLSLMLLDSRQAKECTGDQRVSRVEEGGVGGRNRQLSYLHCVELKDMFNSAGKGGVERLKCLLLGSPGAGKTMTCYEVLRQWGKGRLLRECKLALYIPARALSEDVQDVWDLLQLSKPCYGLNESEMAGVRDFVKKNSNQVLLVVDGLDEVPKELISGDSHFSRLLRGNPLASCRIIATSRPCKQARELLRLVDVRYQLCELTDEQQQAMRQDRLSAEDCAEFEKQLKDKPQIRPLLGNPLQATLIISMFRGEAGQLLRLPSGLCDVYGDVITRALQRYVTRNLKLSDCDLSDSVDMAVKHKCVEDSRVSGVAKVLEEVEKLALDGLVNQQYLFPVSKVASEALESGLLVHWRVSDINKAARLGLSCQFIHLTIQEFLAARCIARHEDLKKAVDGVIKAIGVDVRRFNFWLCLAGMLDKEHLVYLLTRIRDAAASGTFEEQKLATRLLLHSMAEVFDRKGRSSWRAGQQSRKSATFGMKFRDVLGKECNLELSHFQLDDVDFNVLCKLLEDDFTVRTLRLESCRLGGSRCEQLAGCGGLLKVETFHIGVNRTMSGTGLGHILKPFCNSVCKLVRMSIRSANLQESDVPTLCRFLRETRTLDELYLSQSMPVVSSESCKLFAAAVKVNRTLTRLVFSAMHIDDEGACALATAAVEQKRIDHLDFWGNDIGDTGGKALLSAAAQLGCHYVDLSFNQLTDDIVPNLLDDVATLQSSPRKDSALKSTSMKLGGNMFTRSAAEKLSEVLSSAFVAVDFGFASVSGGQVTDLQPEDFDKRIRSPDGGRYKQLDLDRRGMGDACIANFQDYLGRVESGESLSLGFNRLTAEGMKPVATALETNRWIQALDLSSNNIGVEGLETILDVICEDGENSTLRYLSLQGNPLVDADMCEPRWERLEVSLCRLVSDCPSLELVGLYATGIGDRGVLAIAGNLPTESAMLWLSLSANGISRVGVEALCKKLQGNTTLCILTLADNKLGDNSIELLNEMQGKRLRRMDTISVVGNPFSEEVQFGPGLLNGRLYFSYSTTILRLLDGCKASLDDSDS